MSRPTLLESLRTLCKKGPSEDTTAIPHLVERGGLTWLCFGSVDGGQESVRQVELYRYGAMLEMIRRAAGSSWLPPRLSLQSTDDGALRDTPHLADVNASYGSPRLAIGIQPDLLGRPLPPVDATAADPRPGGLGGDPSFEDCLRAIVRTQLLRRRSKLADTARMLSASPRQLQRSLAEHGTTFSSLLEDTRNELARDMLVGSDEKLATVAKELGYRHATHFSRAFKRAHGISPRRYRSIHRQ